jgi:ribosomal protein L37E
MKKVICEYCGSDEFTRLSTQTFEQEWIIELQEWDRKIPVDTLDVDICCRKCGRLANHETLRLRQ